MRKTLAFIFAVFLFPLFTSATAKAMNDVDYAVINADATLYRKSNDSYNPVCSLPSTYFVAITASQENGYYPVRYDDIEGFVPVSAVTPVDYEPVTKFATPTLTIKNDGHPANLRSSADHRINNVLLSLPSQSVIRYYGTAKGSTQVEQLGDLWYYVCAGDDEKTWGYVYSLYVDATPITENVIEKVERAPDTVENSTNEGKSATLSPLREGIIIGALCLPVFLIAYLLFKKPKRPI